MAKGKNDLPAVKRVTRSQTKNQDHEQKKTEKVSKMSKNIKKNDKVDKASDSSEQSECSLTEKNKHQMQSKSCSKVQDSQDSIVINDYNHGGWVNIKQLDAREKAEMK